MPTTLDLRKRKFELAREHLCQVAREVSERHPEMIMLVSAVAGLDYAMHRLYEEEAAIAA